MAAARKAKEPEKFMLLWSECGEDSQLELYDEAVYASVKAAKDSCKDDGLESSGRMYVVQVVATGKAKGFGWD